MEENIIIQSNTVLLQHSPPVMEPTNIIVLAVGDEVNVGTIMVLQ